VDHGFGAVRVGLVVAGEASVVHEPADAAFDGPPSRDVNPRVPGGRWTGWTSMPRRAPWSMALVR
jgi:hypothetical protein